MAFFRGGRIPELLYISRQQFGAARIDRSIHRHHGGAELCFVYLGVGEYIVGNEIYEIEPGDILLYNRSDFHELNSSAASCEIGVYGIGISHLSLDGLPDDWLCVPGSGFVRPTGRYRDTFDRMCSLLFELAERRDPGARETANHLLAALILLAVDLPCDERTREPSAEITLAARLRSYIAMHFQEQITLESISKAVGVSPYYAAHVFKKVFGTSPIQYMIRCRMGEAQNLLITSDFSVTQIAAMVGYTGANHFTTLFTKITGLSPTQYRTWYRENLHGKCTQ